MCQDKPFCVFSETGPLKQVMLHRPGNELNRLTISNMSDLFSTTLSGLSRLSVSTTSLPAYFDERDAKCFISTNASQKCLKIKK